MKTLIVYEKDTGNVSFTQTLDNINVNIDFESIIADVPEDRIVARVKDGEAVLEDTPEEKERKAEIEKLKKEIMDSKLKLLEMEMEDELC